MAWAFAIYWRFAGLFALSALASAAALVAMAPNLPITTLVPRAPSPA